MDFRPMQGEPDESGPLRDNRGLLWGYQGLQALLGTVAFCQTNMELTRSLKSNVEVED